MYDMTSRALPWSEKILDEDNALSREWLVTNGLGGFASGTVSGIVTRRYHGLLVAALPAPLGRTVMLNHIHERVILADGETVDLSYQELTDRRAGLAGFRYLKEFRLEMGLPVWRYEIGSAVLEKRIVLPHLQNTVHINYRLISADQEVRLELRPAIHFRPQEASVDKTFVEVKDYSLMMHDNFYELRGGEFLPLNMKVEGAQWTFTTDRRQRDNIFFRLEDARGYAAIGEHWSPGFFSFPLQQGREATLIASTEASEKFAYLSPQDALTAELKRRQHLLDLADPHAKAGTAAELVLAADQFIITPAGRADEAAKAQALGGEAKTIIAGYHWFTDWGRDTMISLEGLTLTTGRHSEAGHILNTFANYVRDGLIPNMFPEHDKTGLYHTADASLWFFHALHRYLTVTGDQETLRNILPKLVDIVEYHLGGTLFNIGVDPEDGLLKQGQEGYQLTWMDAKVNDWVVTPRRGKAVELNALWYNALCLLENWLIEEQQTKAAAVIHSHAERAKISFNQRFWYAEGGYLYDVIDGPDGVDTACRPNQIFSISLDHPILDKQHWESVLDVVKTQLLTPVGLRSLSPEHPDYKPTYMGDLLTRDAAYHQGTVWGWLIGPFVDAWLKVHPHDQAGVRHLLAGFVAHLDEAGVGTISEIFDAEAPFKARGCIAQAWSVAEVLRCWVKSAG